MKWTKLNGFQSFQEIKKEGRAQLKGGTKFWGPKSKYRKAGAESRNAGRNDVSFRPSAETT